MLYDYLAEFFTVAQTGSLTKASELLALSSSALSRHMHALEQGLGLTLFARNPPGIKGIKLTTEGQHVFRSAGDMVEIMEGVEFYAQAHRANQTSSVSIYGVSEYPSIIRNLKQAVENEAKAADIAVPHIAFVPKENLESRTPLKAVEEGAVDLYLTHPSNNRALSNLPDSCCVVPAFDVVLVAAMDATHPLASKSILQPEDLNGTTLRHVAEDYSEAHTFWLETKRVLRDADVHFQSTTTQFRDPTDWCNDFDNAVLIIGGSCREVESLRIYGKSIAVIEGLTGSYVSIFKKDNDAARFVAECAQNMGVQ